MSQVGHADSKMTMDVYAQLQQRVDRSHGENFDWLVREARERVASLAIEDEPRSIGSRLGHDGEKPTKRISNKPRRELSKSASSQRTRRMARPGLEPGTPRFSA